MYAMKSQQWLVLCWIVICLQASEMSTDAADASDDKKPQGDVKFVCDDTRSGDVSTDNEGVVMVYDTAKQSYVKVCRDGFSRQAAAAVCHQRGYIDAQPFFPGNSYYGTPHQLGCNLHSKDEVTDYFYTSIRCPSNSDYVFGGAQHIMRCIMGPVTRTSCMPATVHCDTMKFQESSQYLYEGEVHLYGDPVSFSGIVQIYLSGETYAVCADNFSNIAATSVCRQLGYTNGIFTPGENVKSGSVLLSDLACNDNTGSFACFSRCVTSVQYNMKCRNVHVYCDFVPEDELQMSDGSRYSCQLQDGPASAVIASVVLGCGYLVELLVVIIIVIVVIWRKRRPRPLLNGGEGQPLNNRPPNQP